MRLNNLSATFFALGLFVGGAASMGLLIGFEPARLPAALLNVAAYKLTFLASLGLIAAGAIVARYARRLEHPVQQGEAAPSDAKVPDQIGAAQDPDAFARKSHVRESDRT